MKTSILHFYQSDPPGKPRKTGFARQVAAVVLLLQWCLTGMANVYNVNTTADGTSSVGTVHLRGAIAAANAAGGTHTINVPAGTYELTLGQISFGNNAQDITITGAGPAATIIRQTTASRIFLINPPGTVADVVTRISGIRFTNGDANDDNFGGGAILCGGRTNSITISNCAFENNRVNPSRTNAGGAIRSNGGGTLSISQSSFTGNSVPNASGSGGAIQYQLTAYSISGVAQNPNGNLTITGSTFNNNTVGSNGTGGAITVQAAGGISGQTLSVNIARNTFTNNNGGSRGGAIHTINSFGTGAANTWNINFNRFVGNQASSGTALQLDDVQGSVDATNNWWGCNSGPAGCSDNAVRGAGNSPGQLITTPYLQLRTVADVSSVCGANATSAFRAGFTTNSAGQTISTSNLTALEGLPISFVATLGTISPANSNISNSIASGIYNAGSSTGTGTINAVVDNVPANDAVARASITINAAPVITSQPAGTFVCSGSRSTVALSVTATGSSLSYQWYRGATLLTNGATGTGSTISGATTSTLTISNAGSADAASDYRVQVTAGASCAVTSNNAGIVSNPSPNIFDEPDDVNICAGNQAVFGVSLSISGNPTFRWFKGSTQLTDGATGNGSSISGTGTNILRISNATPADNASNYYMIISSSNGCADTTRNTTLVVNPAPAKPVITASGPTSFCSANGRVTLSAPAGFASYTWSNGATTQSITVTQSGSYSVTVSNGTCSSVASDAVSVTAIPSPNIFDEPDDVNICAGNQAVFGVSLSVSGNPTFRWFKGSTQLTDGATGNGSSISGTGTNILRISNATPADNASNYYMTITSSNGCADTTRNTTLVVNPGPAKPVITASGPITFCAGGRVTLSAPAGFASYTWSNGATTQSITVTQSGSYSVTVSNGTCSSVASDAIVVDANAVPEQPAVTVGGPTTFCAGGSVTLTAPTGFTYLWSTGATTQSITVSQTGTYTVAVTNNSGCTSPSSNPVSVTVNPLPARPSIALSGPTTFCAGGSVTLTAPAGFTYLWSTGATTQSIAVSQTGTYTVTITNSNGCSIVSLPTTVTVNPLPAKPVIAVGGPTTFCAGGSVTLTAPAGFTYLWSTGATTQSITVSQTGTYTVTVTNNSGCTGPVSDAVNVTVNPLPAKPTVIASGPTIFNEGDSVILTAPAGFTYLWSTGATTQSIVVYTAGSYTVAVTNSNGCTSAPSDPVVVNLYVDPVIFVTVTGAGNRSGLNWANAISNGQIQSKMSSVVRKSQFWVKTGTYYPTDYPDGCSNCNSDRDRAFLLRNNVGLYGGFAGTEFLLSQRNVAANPTLLSGDVGTPGNNGDNSYHVVISISNDSSARLDGFTVTGGNANGYGERYFMYVNGAGLNQSSGAGIYNLRSAPFIANTTIEANSSSSSGAGIYNVAASPIVAFSTVANNSSSYNGGGMASRSSSAPVVTNTQFRSNYAAGEGGGIFNEYSTLNITNSSFVTNNSYSGGGIANYGATATITNTAFAANNANNGGGVYNIYTSAVAITNSVFASNTAGSGGAVYNSSASPVIVNSTFYTNATSNNGSNFYNSNANPTITNSIIWSSGNGAGISNQSSSPSITSSIVKGGYPGTGNLNADPLFVNAGNPAGADGIWGTADDGLKLQATSPAINAGNNAAVPAGITTDITGAARIQGGIVDLGAYEEALSIARTNGAGKSDVVAKTQPATAESREVILTAFPVPAKDMIWVKTNATASTGNNLVIMDARGRIIQSVRISAWPQRIDISTLAPGTYFIKANTGKAIAFTKQ